MALMWRDRVLWQLTYWLEAVCWLACCGSMYCTNFHVSVPHVCMYVCTYHSSENKIGLNLVRTIATDGMCTYNLFISDFFLHRWPKVGSILWPPHYKSREKNSNVSNNYQICSNRSEPCSLLNKATVCDLCATLQMWPPERSVEVK